jgi:ubiquitin-conjugating enzyme E2 Q
MVALDSAHRVVMGGKSIEIPDPQYQIDKLLEARQFEVVEENPDAEDQKIFSFEEPKDKGKQVHTIEDSEEEDDDDAMDYEFVQPAHTVAAPAASSSKGKAAQKAARPADDWKHDPQWVEEQINHLMPPPLESTPGATMAVQRELKSMLKEQETCASFKELGWYMPEDFMGDNLFQWIVEMHSFDPDIPIAKDMASK